MDLNDLIPIMGILLVMIPVAGITLGLTLRFAVKPLVETLAAALRDGGGNAVDERRELVALMDSVDGLRTEVARLREERTFDRELLAAQSSQSASAPREIAGAESSDRQPGEVPTRR